VKVSEQQQQNKQFRPSTDLDLQVMTINPALSSGELPPSIEQYYKTYGINEEGQVYIKKDYASILQLYTRDFRLGNISKETYVYACHMQDLHNDIVTFLPDDFRMCSIACFHRVVTRFEFSQSIMAKVRTLLVSIFQHQNIKSEETSAKRGWFNFFGGKK
jgi:hypothetical protein